MKPLFITLFSIFIFSACKKEPNTILITGDSWGFFVCINGSLDKALTQVGIQDASANTNCAITTRVGIRAENWVGSKFYEETMKALQDPSVRIMYLSLGGNDFLNHWKKSLSPAEEQEVFDNITKNLNDIIKIYQAARPDIKILISGYDYPRFTPDHPVKAYRETYLDMESPTPAELNHAILRFSESTSALADQKNVFFIQHYGLMHFFVGNEENHLAPQTTLPPVLISSTDQPNRVGGDPNFQNDPKAMLQLGTIVDAFHLNKFGFDKLAEHSVGTYIQGWLSSN